MILSLEQVEEMRVGAENIRCPFFRRRAGDVVDILFELVVWVSARHKRLDFRPVEKSCAEKLRGKEVQEVMSIVEEDFRRRKYYITGLLTSQIYRDDCLFESPDPDLPVVGLKKYVNAAANLFDRKLSSCDLLSIEVNQEKNSMR